MTLAIRLNGVDYVNFVQARVDRFLEAVASSFSFTATASDSNFIPIREGDAVEIIADREFPIMTGFVDKYISTYDAKSHTITVQGRSKLSDLVDSTVGAVKEFENVNFVDLCRNIIDDLGIDTGVINQAGSISNFAFLSSAETGQSAFDFLQNFARKRQVLMTDDGFGNLILTRASTTLSGNTLQNIIDRPGEVRRSRNNNIIAGSRTVDISKLYNQYLAQSQLNPIDLNDNPEFLVDQFGEAFDPEIRPSKRFEFYTEEATESFTLEDRAKWELAIRRARGFVYSATVQGHSFNDELWFPNILYQIDDEFANISGQLLCNKISYLHSTQTGSTTKLDFTNRNAYTLAAERDRLVQREDFF